jgi:CRISPR-associated protein Cas2
MPRRRYLLGSDISDDKRLRSVHRCARSFGYPLQYSLFICDLSAMELTMLKWQLRDLIVHTIDRVVFIDIGDPEDERRLEFVCVVPSLPSSGPRVV